MIGGVFYWLFLVFGTHAAGSMASYLAEYMINIWLAEGSLLLTTFLSRRRNSQLILFVYAIVVASPAGQALVALAFAGADYPHHRKVYEMM